MLGQKPHVSPATGEGRELRAWLDPSFAAREPARGAELLRLIFELAPRAAFRRLPGRETFAWPGREEWVVKRFRGGESRERWHELLRGATPRSPGRREGENLAALGALGLPVPRPLAWIEEAAALGFGGVRRSAVVMAHVAHRETLRQRLARASPREAAHWSTALAELVAELHAAGWYHRDLYLQHVVLAADAAPGRAALTLLDLGRARSGHPPRARWLVKDLAALLHSTPSRVGRAERLRFLARWLELGRAAGGRGRFQTGERSDAGDGGEARRNAGEERELRSWARRVLAKQRVLAAHAPRHVDPLGRRGEEAP